MAGGTEVDIRWLKVVDFNSDEVIAGSYCGETLPKSMEWTIICSLGAEPVKLFIEVSKHCFRLAVKFLLETISGFIIKIPLIRTKISLLWDLN